MNCSHVGHDCVVGDDVRTSATLGGHCETAISSHGGLSALHQFGRVGSQVMVSAMTAVRVDIIPFGLPAASSPTSQASTSSA